MSTKKKNEKKAVKKTAPNAPKLHEFLVKEAGGAAAVRANFARAQLAEFSSDMTIQDAFDKAEEDGWGAEFGAMPLSVLRGGGSSKRTKRKNIPGAKVQADILAHMTKGKTYKSSVVAKALGYPTDSVRRAYVALVAEKKVVQKGVKRATTYSLA
jgi:hypothetical protein